MKHYRIEILLALFILIIAEIIWSWRKDKKVYEVKETLANLSIFIGFHLSKFLFAGYQLMILDWAADLAPWRLPHNLPTFIACFLLADFVYYWFHRVSHSWKPLWAFHLIHHSSMSMNLTTAYRLNWFGALLSPLFFIPLSIAGFPPDLIVASYALNLLYQFFLHTESVGKLGPLEGFIDTPSAHRVHHGSNAIYIDKNFGGMLIIWDKLFGTYQPETEKVRYGIPTGFISYNPFKLVFKGFIDLFKTKTLLLVLLLSILVIKGSAQTGSDTTSRNDSAIHLKGSSPESRAQLLSNRMKEKLDLTDEQYQKVSDINLTYAKKMAPILQSDAGRFAKYRKSKSIMSEKDDRLKSVLTHDQFKQYQTLKKEMMDKARESMRQSPAP